ncbi:hypothetical protein B0H16DRAFT_1782080 [Mycena metata]|uniref:F-box domain-containing protein n=1 Tax=Mycena metata TaxID=1033252 RepID=A0AAD7HQ78_9AGAR|nr:hypothetical protein B0H16DRAFT_1782080 [Mycena metata]
MTAARAEGLPSESRAGSTSTVMSSFTSSAVLRLLSAQLAAEIAELRMRLAGLVAKHEHVQSKLDSIIYPVLQLPPEITAEIFMRCSPDRERDAQIMYKAEMLFPLRLASVCRDWRAVALSTPRIWGSMNICLNSSTHLDFQRRLALCGDAPLSLELCYNFRCRLDIPHIFPLAIAIDHCRNWETVKIDLMGRDVPLLNQVKGSLPLLHELHVSVYGVSAGVGDAFGDAPRLRNLTLTILDTGAYTISATHFPWEQLTTFNGDGLSVEGCFNVLRLASQLSSCTFSGWFGIDDGLPSVSLHLPNLRSLRLMNHERFGWFLGSLTLPHLEDLHISILPRQVSPFCDFICRSACSLRTLGLRTSSSLSPEILLQLWEAVPTVTHIDVSPSIFCDQMTRLLWEKSNLLPRLESAIVNGRRLPNYAMDHQLLVNMLRSRQHSLRSFSLFASESSNISARNVSQLISISKTGMDIQMDVTVPFQALVSR